MKIFGKNNQYDNQPVGDKKPKKSDVNYEEKDIANSPDPAEYLGRSQVVFSGRGVNKGVNKGANKGENKGKSVNREKSENAKKPDFTPIKLTETPILSKEEAVEHLKKYHFSDEDIKALDFDDQETLSQVSNFKAYLDSGIVEEKDLKDFKEYMDQMDPEKKKGWLEHFSGPCKYANKDNVDIIKKYLSVNEEHDLYNFIEFLQEANAPEKFLEKLPIITYFEGKIEPDRLRDYRYISDDVLDSITPERADILGKINAHLPEDSRLRISSCVDLAQQEKELTPELIKKHCNFIDELSKVGMVNKSSLKYSYAGDTIADHTSKMEKVAQMLKDYPMDLKSSDDSTIILNNFYDLAQRDGEEVQKYINSLTPDAKFKGIEKYIYDESGIPKDKMAELCNIIYDKAYGKIYDDTVFKFIDENKGENCENIPGLVELLKAYKGTDVLQSYHPEYKLHVENKDFKGASEAIKLKLALDKAGLYFNDSAFYEVMYDKDADFGKFNALLQFMLDNSVNYYDYPYKIYRDKDGLNKLDLRHHVKTNGWWLSEDQYKELDSLAADIKNDDEKSFVKENLFKRDKDNRAIFYVKDVTELLEAYRKHPDIITDILNEKREDGDVRYKRVHDTIIPISEAMALDKDYTKYLLNMKEYRGHQRFGFSSLKDVVEAHLIDKDFTNKLMAEVAVMDKHGIPHYKVDKKILKQLNENKQPDIIKDEDYTKFRHSSADIRRLVDIHKKDPEFTEFLLDKYKDVQTSTDDIEIIVDAAQKDKEMVKTLLSETTEDWNGTTINRFSPYVINHILTHMPSDKQFVYDIVAARKEDPYRKGKTVPQYANDDIMNLCEAAFANLELTKVLQKEKVQYSDKDYDRFGSSDIKQLVNMAQTDRVIFNDVLKQTKEGYRGPESRYSASDLQYIMQAVDIDKECTKGLIKLNEEYPDRNVYSSYEMVSIANAHKDDPEYTDILLSKKAKNYKDENIPLLKGDDITHILAAHKKDPVYTDKLVAKYEKTNGNDETSYNGSAIERIVNAHLFDKDLTEELENQTVRTKDGIVHRFSGEEISTLVSDAQKDKEFIVKNIINNTTTRPDGSKVYTFYPYEISTLLSAMRYAEKTDPQSKDYLKILVENKGLRGDRYTTKFSVDEIEKILKTSTFEQYKKLESVVGKNIKNYNANDILTAMDFEDLLHKQAINEIPIKQKKDLLRRLVAANTDLFNTSDAMKKDFPLLPKDQDEYCEVLPALVRSIGIETNTLSEKQVADFNKNLTDLSGSLAKMSDREYNSLKITQEYDKNIFIKDVLEKVKDLEPEERQKVYDYFGFELSRNYKNYMTGFSIIGYPVNLNNGKKLAEITDEKTKKVVENLRPDVIRFSEKNKIKSNNKNIEKELNKIVEVLPEIRTMIGKDQHSAHDFDVFKHSLKVMQKIRQDENFEKLNPSDKKVMLLATLMHDITKIEGKSDGTHPTESAYDTFFITKKFNLTKDEEIKLYSLIRHHEWLSCVNTANSDAERTKAQQSVAFDLQQDNLFDMALMFTHADLKAVKDCDIFHDKTEGDSRIDYNGQRRSFGEAADFHAAKIKEYIGELKKTQPLLPSTKMPKASDIEKLITRVNPDGSTNIKGVYVKEDENKKRLVVLKFNEVENEGWEKMGLPKGSSTKGTIVHCNDGEETYDVETGNIKFFVHGLDYPNQLAKFDAFSMLNSDALLSVSYAERPETKYRFFRAQGVMLDVSADYVYGGGNTDAGSGCGKDIQKFKDGYVFGGFREHDRKYISDMVKEATGMNDDEYVKFFDKNKNKPMAEIEPKEYREKIIKAFATINSNVRKGDREYNEMYLSNPKSVMGVYAYNWTKGEAIPDPIKFLDDCDNRTHFLQDYAKEHDIPFVIFGD